MGKRFIASFVQLRSWQQAHSLVLQIYDLTKKFPKEEQFCLTQELRRSAISVSSNIAEGFGRRSKKEKRHFCNQALGSFVELKNQIIIAKDVGYLKLSSGLVDLLNETEYLIRGLINAQK